MRLVLILSLLFAPAIAQAHARLIWPPPRSDNSGVKVGPCGNYARGSATPLEAGSTIEVQFEETINHPGWFRLAIGDQADQGFDQAVIQDGIPHSEEGVPSYSNPRPYRVTITVPDRMCAQCTLQLIQIMTDKSKINGQYQSYYSCADVSILPEGSVLEQGGCRCGGSPPLGSALVLVLGMSAIACIRAARRRS